jgi:radical SAM superfamily enzyme YgiQ (UPF0313 family)
MTGTQIKFALKAADMVRSLNPLIPLIWGGIHPTLTPDETIRDSRVDVVVVGEGEETFPELVEALHYKSDLKNVPGLVFKNNSSKPTRTADRIYADINSLPPIPYHLVNVDRYFYDVIGAKALPMLFSRGCPHRCGFCYRSNFPPPKWRALSIERTIKEIKNLIALGAKTIIPLDDNFFVDRARVTEICEALEQENINVNFHVNCRIDYADSMDLTYLSYLRDHGFISWDFGVESGCQKTLDFMKKDITTGQVIRVNQKLQQVGIVPTYSFMGGFLKETYTDLKHTINIMFKLVNDYPEAYLSPIKIYTPFPGTKMIPQLPTDYFHPSTTLAEWAEYDYNSPHIVWHNKKQTKLLEQISYYSYFIDPKRILTVFANVKLLRFILVVYSYFAKLRLKKDIYAFSIDFVFMKLFYRMKKFF